MFYRKIVSKVYYKIIISSMFDMKSLDWVFNRDLVYKRLRLKAAVKFVLSDLKKKIFNF